MLALLGGPAIDAAAIEPTIEQRFEAAWATAGLNGFGLVLRPFITQEIGSDDNVFSTQRGARADIVSITTGGATLAPRLDRHAASLGASASLLRLLENTRENAWTGQAHASGRFDVSSATQLGVDVVSARVIEERGNPDSIAGAAEPVIALRHRVEPWLRATTGRLTHRLGVEGRRVTYGSIVATDGGRIDLASRDFEQAGASYRLGFLPLDEDEIFVRLGVFDRRAVNPAGRATRNLDGASAALGVAGRLTPLISGIAAFGVQHIGFDDPRIGDAVVATAELRVAYEPRRWLRLDARYLRDFAESIVATAADSSAGHVRSVFALRATAELRGDLLATAEAVRVERRYLDLVRDETLHGFDLGLRHAVAGGLFVSATYAFRQERRDGQRQFTRNVLFTRLTKAF